MTARIYLEGGGDAKDLHVKCRQGFRSLLQACGFSGRLPRLVACGGREAAFDDFRTAHANRQETEFVALWIDSEEPVADVEEAWAHLDARDQWDRPAGAVDEQVLLMTTCMETWLVADHDCLRSHYGQRLQESALPKLVNLESRPRAVIQDRLEQATRQCSNAYRKGRRSFDLLANVDPAVLGKLLPSFARVHRILDQRL